MWRAGKWDGIASPLQLSNWTVTDVGNGRTSAGRPLRTFRVVRTGGEVRPPAKCGLGCGQADFRLNGREGGKGLVVSDVPAFGCAVKWSIARTRLVCRSCGAERFEVLPGYVDLPTNMLVRLHHFIRREASTRSFLSVATEVGLSESAIRGFLRADRQEAQRCWGSVERTRDCDTRFDPRTAVMPLAPGEQREFDNRLFWSSRAVKVDRLGTPRYLGLDEISLVDRKNPDKAHVRELHAVLVDLEAGNVVDILADNKADTIAEWIASRSPQEQACIKGVVVDMYGPYQGVVLKALPHASLVIDRFHVETKAQAAADRVRIIEVKRATRRARKANAKARHNDEDLRMYTRMLRSRNLPRSPERRKLLREYLMANPLTYHAVLARQDFRMIYETARNSTEARTWFGWWEEGLHPRIRGAFAPLLKNLHAHETSIYAYFDLPLTNGPTESANSMIRRIVRPGPKIHVETLRAKVLLRGRLRPGVSFFCDRCRRRAARDEDRDEMPDGGLVCWECRGSAEPVLRLRRPSRLTTLRELFAEEAADARPKIPRRGRKHHHPVGEQLRLTFARWQSMGDEPLPWEIAAERKAEAEAKRRSRGRRSRRRSPQQLAA